MATSVKIRILNDLVSPDRVPGVLVQFYTTSAVFVTSGTTDSQGEVTVLLPDATYNVLFYKVGVSILPKQPQQIVVDTLLSNVFEVTSHVSELPESVDPLRCRITGYMLDLGGHRMVRGPRLRITTCKSLIVIGPSPVSPVDALSVAPDTNGLYDFELLRGQEYECYIDYLDNFYGSESAKLTLSVPDQPALDLANLLFPVLTEIEFSDSTKTIALVDGDNNEITYVQHYSDQTEHPGGVPWSSLKLTNSDETVVQANLMNGLLVLTPLKTGTVTLTSERTLSGLAVFLPEPVFTPSSITVTVT